MSKGPFGGPRPFTSSTLVIGVGLDISKSELVDMSQRGRDRVLERNIRDETGMMIDLKPTPSYTAIVTGRQKMDFSEIEELIRGIERGVEKSGAKVVKEAQVLADGD